MVIQQLYAAAPQAQRPALRQIRRLSLPFEIVFAALAAMIALMFALIVMATFAPGLLGVHVRVGPEGGELMLGGETNYAPNSIDIGEAPLLSRLAGLIVLVGVLGSQIAAFFSLYKLFGAYRRGIVFAETSMRWMRRAACFLIIAGVAPLAFQPLVHAAGLRDQHWFQGHYLAFLIVGAALFVMAGIIALGREIEKEGEGYV